LTLLLEGKINNVGKMAMNLAVAVQGLKRPSKEV